MTLIRAVYNTLLNPQQLLSKAHSWFKPIRTCCGAWHVYIGMLWRTPGSSVKPQQRQAPVVVSAGPRTRCFGSSSCRRRREEGLAAQVEASARSENECIRLAQGRNRGSRWGRRQGPRTKRGAEVRHSSQGPQTIPRGAAVKPEGKLKGWIILTQRFRLQSGGTLLRGMPRRQVKMRSWGAALKAGEGSVPLLKLLLPAQLPDPQQCPQPLPTGGVSKKPLPGQPSRFQQHGLTSGGTPTGTATRVPLCIAEALDFLADFPTPPEVSVIGTKAFEVINSGWWVKNDCRNSFP